MFDIGLGEILILGVIALLVFGPEKLPKAAADAGRLVRSLRSMAVGARKDLADSAGIDMSEMGDTLSTLRDLHPRRIASSLLDDTDDVRPSSTARATPPDTGPRAAYDPDAT